jgi:DNA-binding transcriptional ArsR family regulator
LPNPGKSIKKDESLPRQVLFTFWDEVPKMTLVELPSKTLSSDSVRPAILRLLREGIIENGKNRRALKAEEIQELLREKHEINMSKTNLYHHLGVLEENNLITKVAKITEGRHKVAYYGRTSKGFLTRDSSHSLENYSAKFIEAGKMAKVSNPDLDLDHVKEKAQEFLNLKQRRDQVLTSWLNESMELIEQHNLDFYQVFEFLKTVDSVNHEYVDFLRSMIDELGIDV